MTTLSDGQVSTSVSTPTAAAAEQAAATTPGQKLEVLPIGLGVFAGVSVIALIVVGLVTYERTKYRKVSFLDCLYLNLILFRPSDNENWQKLVQIWDMEGWREY